MRARKTTEYWLSLIEQCRNSGLTDRQWCLENNIPFSTFYYHVSDLRKKACDLPQTNTSEITPYKQDVVPLQIINEQAPSAEESAAIRIQVKGISIDIRDNDASATPCQVLKEDGKAATTKSYM